MTAAEKAYHIIREAIASGEYPGGYHLTEGKMSLRTELSRTPVREALRQLQREGWVTLIANCGVFVNAFSHEEIEDLFQVRLCLEPSAARLAAERIRSDDVRTLDDLNHAMREAVENPNGPSLDVITRVNDAFHNLVITASGSSRLRTALDSIAASPVVFTTFHRYDRKQMRRSLANHCELTDALRARDGDWAYATMVGHLSAARQIFRLSREAGLPVDQAARRPGGPADAGARPHTSGNGRAAARRSRPASPSGDPSIRPDGL